MNYAVVIPTKTARNVGHCIAAIWENEPDIQKDRVIVVDDGVDWGEIARCHVPKTFRVGFKIERGVKPFVFARNCNIGIKRAFEDGADVAILLNDDALLNTAGGFSSLAKVTAENERYGVIAAACNNVGNPNQFYRGVGLRDEPRMVCFVCVAISRKTIEEVGYLDERYTGYGMDDDDYCFEVRKKDLSIGVFDGCVVDHKSLESSYRGAPTTPSDFRPNMQLFIDKWGQDNHGLPAEQARKKWAVPT